MKKTKIIVSLILLVCIKINAGDCQLTPNQRKPIELQNIESKLNKTPYFVNRYSLSQLPQIPFTPLYKHPLNRQHALDLDMPASFGYWVGSGKMSSDQWLGILRQGDPLLGEEFNLDGFDSLLQRIDEQISERGGVNELTGAGNETRTLLMDYATTGNLPAVQYLIDKGAALNVEDSYYGQGNPGRTAIIFPAYYGHADVVEYFASDRFPKIDIAEAKKWADGYNQSREGFSQSKKDRILAALNKIDAKPQQRPFAGGCQAAR